MNKHQLTTFVIEPTLKEIPRGYTNTASVAIQMIIAHESHHGHYIKQVGTGPALGLIQMEPATHESTWNHGDSIWRNAVSAGIITEKDLRYRKRPDCTRLIYDLKYNVFMARQRLFMIPESFPEDTRALSEYLKRHWNTTQGKAKGDSYLNAWNLWKYD